LSNNCSSIPEWSRALYPALGERSLLVFFEVGAKGTPGTAGMDKNKTDGVDDDS